MTTAKELAVLIAKARDYDNCNDTDIDRLCDGAEQLIPKYRPPQPSDDGKWCWIEHPPEQQRPYEIRLIYGTWKWFSFVLGWRELKGNVWPCERPEVGT